MEFRIADTFSASLGKLTAAEQKSAKTTAFDLQMNASAPGLSYHRLDRAKDPNFWSVRVSDDIRIIVHRTGHSLLLAYVDHHDAAYRWAERRKIERHPTTGAMQLVEIRERVQELPVAPAAVTGPKLFAALRKPELMAMGVPEEWLEDVRGLTEETLFDVLAHLPQEAQEELLRLAVGEKPPALPAAPPPPVADPFAHPDAQRRFRLLHDVDELRRALDFPWDRWAVFLHPSQRSIVERRYSGPTRVTGSAGTGKTIVALHRAVHLARAYPRARVLLATFSKPLARALASRLEKLVGGEPAVAARITAHSMTGIAYDLYSAAYAKPNIAPAANVQALLRKVSQGTTFAANQAFLAAEWNEVVDAQQTRSWASYRDAPRLGRKTRLGEKQRQALWEVFASVQASLVGQKLVTWAEVFIRLGDRAMAGQ